MNYLKVSLKLIGSAILMAVLLFSSCNKDEEDKPTEFSGLKINVGDGQAWSFIKTDEAGKPISVGIKFDETALNNLPTGDVEEEYLLELPDEIDVAPYNHITLGWNPKGHEPAGVYNLPHFDAHFYFVSEAQRAAVNLNDSVAIRKPLSTAYMPPQYLDPNEAVPDMGVHLIDLLSPEIAGTGSFTKTFIYGKYNGNMTFLEPMLTLEYIKSKPNKSIAIRQPQKWQKKGYYPKSYALRFNATKKEYAIILEGLEQSAN